MLNPNNDRCRRCGTQHDEAYQIVDPLGRWAIRLTRCRCGHRWTTINTSPSNLPALKAWVARGLREELIPPTSGGHPWLEYRLEGVCPPIVSVVPSSSEQRFRVV